MLPKEFTNRMRPILGEEAEPFFAAMSTADPVRAIRLNPRKTDRTKFLASTDLDLAPLSYTDGGFTVANGASIGASPAHHAGMYYIQDPGAMAPVCALDVMPGSRVADLCAAPGGKSGQLADLIGEDGFLLSNEYVPKRAKTVVSNFERLGIRNAIVTSVDTREIAGWFDSFFDAVVVDAPCSGEGMFRKSEEALADWSVGNILACAERQKAILDNAAGLVRDGGKLLYATCTFAPEEDEEQVAAFLDRHPDFRLIPVRESLRRVTADGIRHPDSRCDLSLCRRFYPHRAPGEGQFFALFERSTDRLPRMNFTSAAKPLSKAERAAVDAFLSQTLTKMPDAEPMKVGDNICLLPRSAVIPPFSVFSAGVLLGSLEKGMVFPSHQFFSAYGDLFCEKENITASDPRTFAYLAGEEIPSIETKSGFCVILFEGAPLGGGKTSSGRIKNHYPKGLRIKK